MTIPAARSFFETHLDAEQADRVTRWRAVQTVRANVAGRAAQDDVLATLGLLDVECPTDAS